MKRIFAPEKRIGAKNKNPRRSLNSARIWRRRWDSNPRDVAVNSISSRARYDRFDTPPCINLSMILYEEIISSQPRYDHFDTSPSYGESPKEIRFSVSDTSGAPRYVPLRCPKFYARCLHRRISTAATRSTPLTPPPGGGRLAPHFDTSPYPEHYTNSPVENQGAWSVPPLASNVSSI